MRDGYAAAHATLWAATYAVVSRSDAERDRGRREIALPRAMRTAYSSITRPFAGP
jgi:hypothetical protein